MCIDDCKQLADLSVGVNPTGHHPIGDCRNLTFRITLTINVEHCSDYLRSRVSNGQFGFPVMHVLLAAAEYAEQTLSAVLNT